MSYVVENCTTKARYSYPTIIKARDFANQLSIETNSLWIVVRAYGNADSIAQVEKSINRHLWKECKRTTYELKKGNREIEAAFDRIDNIRAAGKAWQEVRACMTGNKLEESSAHDMTQEERKEWGAKFFAD